MEISHREKRRRLKAFWIEYHRVEALRRKILTDEAEAERRAEFFVDHGFLPPPPALPSFPEFPPECRDMVCGGKGRRRSGQPCQSKEIHANGRCKWHGGLSTGPKTVAGRAKSAANLPVPKVIGT